ncbi:conserved Plasmodium protein, unknown function [Plasmodium chabaudi chabaudi]|uniref:E3 ubiquitin-protein ligase listerin n=1 Tax=Plasmodium chabaudi chabaudi TaxID=31271 RepID=A0A1C6YNZ4_PLACU|nr:conserved Plasmodium protein, unknown function [Plasmodium chabaudi chabaudi]
MKKKKVIKLKDEYVPKGNYINKDALLTNIFLDTNQNEITDVESQHSFMVTNCISKLQKKNLQTKLKALNDLVSHLNQCNEDELNNVFPSFLNIYKKLIYHPNYNVRECLNICLQLFIKRIKKKIKNHLQIFCPPLFISVFDYNKNVKNIAKEILSLIFPKKEIGNEELVEINNQNSDKKKQKKNINKIKMQEENKLYQNIKTLNVNITNLYNCLKYIKDDLEEAVTTNLNNTINNEDYDSTVYLFNVLCFFPSLIYLLVKNVKDNIEFEKIGDQGNASEVTKKLNNELKERIKNEFSCFHNIYQTFFKLLNSVYKNTKYNLKLRKIIYLSVYNIIYILKKNKINYFDLNDNESNVNIYNYISCLLSDKEEYILKNINHILLMYFYSENNKMINTNFLRSYLSLVKQNKVYQSDIFNFNIPLFIYIFQKTYIQQNFFFAFFIFYFLLLNKKKSSLIIYYDILSHLCDVFSPFSPNQKNVQHENGGEQNDGEQNGCKPASRELELHECCTALRENIFLLPLEMILIQKRFENYGYCFKNMEIYDILENTYYCSDAKSLKKKDKNKNNDNKKKTKLIDLRKNIEKEIIKENEFIDIFTNFINSFENLYDVLLIDVLDMLDFYISKLFEIKHEEISKDETLLDSTKEKTTNGGQGSYIYNDGINFILKLLLKLKNLIFENGNKQIDINKFNYTQERFINTFKNVFDSIFNLIKLKYYEIIPNLENNFFILHFVCNHINDKNEYFTSLINIFKFFENIIYSEHLENNIYFSLIRVCLNFVYLFYEENVGDPPQLASALVKTLLEDPSNEHGVEVKLEVCVELINFMKSKNKKIVNIEERVLSIYTEYISIPLSENNLNNNSKKNSEDNLVQSFYTALYIDFSQNNILFGNNFYNNILYIYKNRMIKNKIFCESNFVEFFLKIFGQTKFGILKYGVGNFGLIENEPDYDKLNDLYLYFLLNIYLKINQKDVETYCINLFSYFKKESIYSCLIMMKQIFKFFSTSCEYNNTLNYSNTDTSDSERFSNKTYDDSDLSDVHHFHFASTEYSDNSSGSRENSWNANKKGTKTIQGPQTCYISGTVTNGIVTCSVNSSENAENVENVENDEKFEHCERQEMRICLEMQRSHVLSDVYIHRLLLLYKIYNNIKSLSMHDVKSITYLFYDEEMNNCLNNSGMPIVTNSTEIENGVKDTTNLDTFFRFIYQNIEREEFVFFLTSLKEELEKDKISRCNKFELFFIIYYYYIKKRKGKKKYMKNVNIDDTSISDIIYIMKSIKNYKILNICKILLKKLNYEEETEDIITRVNKLFLETASNELINFKATGLYQLKIKLFMFKECVAKYIKKYNYCIERNEVGKPNEVDHIESYSDKINKIKGMVPENLHTYIDRNFSLTLCEKNEIGSLNLIYHLICISKHVHNYNLFNFPLVEDFIKNIKYVSQKNYDIYFCAIHLIISKEEGEMDSSEMKNVKPKIICDSDDEVYKINDNSFFETNKIMIKGCLNNYLSFLNGHYKKIWNKQIFFYKKKIKTIDSVLGNKLKTTKTGKTESNSSKIKKIKQKEDISTNYTDTIYGQNKMGLYFLKFIIFLMTKKDKQEIIEDANMMKNLIKLIYFILSINQCKNSLVHKKLKLISIQVLKELMGKFSHYLNGTKKINFLSLYLGIDNYKTIFNQHNKSSFFFDEIDQNNITSEILRRIKRRVFDMYLSTYYLYILILNLDKYKKNTMFIYRILNILLLNSLFIKELQQIKKNNQKLFEILSAYLFIDGNCPNEFLYSFFNSNIDEYEELIINKINNDQASDSESSDNISRASYNHEQAENGEHGESIKKVENADWKENIPLGTQVYFHKTESDFFSDNNCLSISKVSKNEKTSDQIANHLKLKQNESSTSQCPTDPLNSNQTHGSFVGESEKREVEPAQNSQVGQSGNTSGASKKKKKANPLFLLKSGLTNPFLMIDLDKNILDLYKFLLKRNYLSILLFLVNICLSSEYFIYDSELYKNFLIYLEEHDVDIYNFLEKFEGIDDISCNSSDSDTKYDLNLLKKNEKKMYIFLLTINLLLQLIAVYPTESIMTINENKLLEIKNINELYLSNLIINNQINELENISKNYNSTTYYYDKFHKTLTFKFKITEDDDTQNFEGVTAKLSLNFMPNYPFSVLIINDKIEALDKRAPIHNSIKSMYKYARIGNINEIFIKFDSLMNTYFQNKSQCNICFMILHDKKTCDKVCSKCSTSYHSYCLHKWFLTSHNTKCPSCQIQFS